MRASIAAAAFLLATLLTLSVRACDPEDTQNGCKISGTQCTCGYGCKTEYIYRTRRECMSALRGNKQHDDRHSQLNGSTVHKQTGRQPLDEWNPNICHRMPCLRGICIQTVQDPGFACKCEGTGFYGKRCEKACPTIPMRGLVFPHECVVI